MENVPQNPPNNDSREGGERIESMTEQETLIFLRQIGAQPLTKWESGQSLLYVLEEKTRHNNDTFGKIPPEKRASIVRIDNPIALDLDVPKNSEPIDGVTYYYLDNKGGQVDYYAIDANGNPTLVKTTNKAKSYDVRKDFLFMPIDDVFPLSKKGSP